MKFIEGFISRSLDLRDPLNELEEDVVNEIDGGAYGTHLVLNLTPSEESVVVHFDFRLEWDDDRDEEEMLSDLENSTLTDDDHLTITSSSDPNL